MCTIEPYSVMISHGAAQLWVIPSIEYQLGGKGVLLLKPVYANHPTLRYLSCICMCMCMRMQGVKQLVLSVVYRHHHAYIILIAGHVVSDHVHNK